MLVLEGCKYCNPVNSRRFLELEIAACVAPRSHLICKVNCLMRTSLSSGLLEEVKIFWYLLLEIMLDSCLFLCKMIFALLFTLKEIDSWGSQVKIC